jgi:NAD(P)-dependent dehydrogenase (short-subunit alcohol dehydrogenase family)
VEIDFTGRTAFVTGGSKGIGEFIAETLAAAVDYAEHGIRINTVSPGSSAPR